MPENNICKFNPAGHSNERIGILNFVYEKGAGTRPYFVVQSVFRLHLVTQGTGSLETLSRRETLSAGDVFFTFPSTEYFINDFGDLEYEYLSFMGIQAYDALARAGIDKQNFFRRGNEELIPFWKQAIERVHDGNIDLISESVLLYTLGTLCAKDEADRGGEVNKSMLQLKKLAEDRFSDPKADLKTLCAELFYNPKYASAAFIKYTGIRFSDFLTSLRINNAMRLMENGLTSVKEIAALSGFEDALYFSRIFRKREGVSPSERIAAIQRERKNARP